MVRPDGGIGRRNGLKIRCPTRTCGFDPRSGYHNIQRLTTFYPTENPLQRPNGMILLVSSRYLLITRILGYFWDIKLKSVAVGNILRNDHKDHSTSRYLAVKKGAVAKLLNAATDSSRGGTPRRAVSPANGCESSLPDTFRQTRGCKQRGRTELSEAFRRLRTILRFTVKSRKGAYAPAFT